MKQSFIKKITAVVLAAFMVFAIVACNAPAPQTTSYPKNGATKIIDVEKTAYASAAQSDVINVAYYESESEILLIEINHAVEEFINEFVLGGSNASVTVEEDASTVTLVRNNGAYCEIDFVADTVLFSDFDAFNMKPTSSNPHDLLAYPYVNEQGESRYLKRSNSFYTPGYAILIDLAERDIPLDIYNGKKYIPLKTFNDLFLVPYGVNLAYNGQDVFICTGNTISADLEERYYLDERTEMSKALAEFSFNELCLYLDLYYGLQAEHGFNDGFSYYLESIGLKEQFLSCDSMDVFNALGTLTLGYIADAHSSVVSPSPYLGSSQPVDANISIAPGFIDYAKASQLYPAVRSEMMPGFQFYEKIGNTAYVTLDEFSLYNRDGDYTPESMRIIDTLALVMFSHSQIVQDEEIENVVLDLSCNGGGAVDSAFFTVAWMLGCCDASIYNSVTQSCATTSYYADVNRDGVFDDNDSIADKNLFCLVSPVSFSCGNYVPALLKASGKVTIIGKTASGGACVVNNGMTADGTSFSLSGSKRMSIVKNGSYYSVDQGVQPDVYLSRVESFYDRAGLTDYINNLK